jgi:hypothetical protein
MRQFSIFHDTTGISGALKSATVRAIAAKAK